MIYHHISMNIIISPAKKININNDDIVNISMPSLLSKTYILYEKLKSLQYEDLKKILNCSDNIAKLNFERYKYMNLERNLSPAIISYEGIQYKYMSPNSFTYDEFEFANNHLKILSGFYGILKPLDGITPYRLEMQSKFNVDKYENLSYHTCINCGKPATKISTGWICPYCDNCIGDRYYTEIK